MMGQQHVLTLNADRNDPVVGRAHAGELPHMRQIAYAIASIFVSTYMTSMVHPVAIFSTLSDPIRLRAMALIARHGELCVCELVAALDLPQPKISRHLAVMRDAGLLRDRRDAQWVLYALSPDLPGWATQVVAATSAALAEDVTHIKDIKRLARANRPARLVCRKAA